MTDKLIASDHPLNEAQQKCLSALLDTLIPASTDGAMPGAGSLDFVGHLQNRDDTFDVRLKTILEAFADTFPELDVDAREGEVQAFSAAHPELFDWLLFNVYTMYYEQDEVLTGIGASAGPPFPRGNTVIDGDLSSLDGVVDRGRGYRRV